MAKQKNKGEKKEEDNLVTTCSRKYFLFFYILCFILFFMMVFIFLSEGELNLFASLGAVLFIIGGVIFTELYRAYSSYEIGSHYIALRKGLITNRYTKIGFKSVSDVRVSQKPSQRLLGYGDVYMSQYGKGGVFAENIDKPRYFMNFLNKKMGEWNKNLYGK